jgi:capsular polysaccharide export protein
MTRDRLDRWWPISRASTLFAVPPFPGSRIGPLVEEHEPGEAAAPDVHACLAAMRRLRVGGTFWAGQRPAATARSVLVRPNNPEQARAAVALAARRGHDATFWFPDAAALQASGLTQENVIVGPHDPWHLLANAVELWADADDEVALIAAVAGTPRRTPEGDALPIDPAPLLAALLDGVAFRDPFSDHIVSPVDFIELLGFWRASIDANRPIADIYGVAFWKRAAAATLLWDGSATDRFRTAMETRAAPAAAAWIARTPPAILAALKRDGRPVYQIEDGFIRSVGLGADCVPPLSIVVDPEGAHYDPAQPSGLERMLQERDFAPDMLERARALCDLIVARGISKYAQGTQKVARIAGDRRHVLVIGQVEDDQSVLKGGGDITSNLDLLGRVRTLEPDAFITYRPHPDVDAGHRKGHINDDVALTLADAVARDSGITALIDAADHVHVLTSLAGFEALMRGRPVTTHGVPFYAGWGLTEDRGPVPTRRTRRRTLDELVAATLLLYPRYLDPVTGLPCPPEILVERVAIGMRHQNTPLVVARRLVGSVMRRLRRLPWVGA